MSRASKLAAARGNAYSARQAANIAREKLQRITNERDELRRELSDLRARLEKVRKSADRYRMFLKVFGSEEFIAVEWKGTQAMSEFLDAELEKAELSASKGLLSKA